MGAPKPLEPKSSLSQGDKSGRFSFAHFEVLVKLAAAIGLVIFAIRFHLETSKSKPEAERLEKAWEQQTAWETGKPAEFVTLEDAYHRGVRAGEILYRSADRSRTETAERRQLVTSSSARLSPQEAVKRAREEQRRGELIPVPKRNDSTRNDRSEERLRSRTEQ